MTNVAFIASMGCESYLLGPVALGSHEHDHLTPASAPLLPFFVLDLAAAFLLRRVGP